MKLGLANTREKILCAAAKIPLPFILKASNFYCSKMLGDFKVYQWTVRRRRQNVVVVDIRILAAFDRPLMGFGRG